MPKHLKKLSEELIHQNPWWEYKHDRYEKPNGEVGDYWYGEEHGSVMIVPVLPDGRLILTLQHRYLPDKQSMEFPGGGVLDNISVLDSAKQELYEETGYTADEWTGMGNFEALAGFFKSKTHVYLAKVTAQGQQHLDDTEEIEIVQRRPDEFDELIARGEILDGKTLAVWALVRHYFIA